MEKDMNMTELQKHGVEGSIRFSIKAEDNEFNNDIHNKFKAYAYEVCGDDYTLALKLLLENVSIDYKYELISDKLSGMEQRIILMEGKLLDNIDKKEDEDKEVAF